MKQLKPRFSIITVTYNAQEYLERTILSVLSQNYPHIEYIIVDGSSTDGTLALVDKYKQRINTVVSEPDQGLYDAMNKGIKLAQGDYLCFLNAGDLFYSSTTLTDITNSLKKYSKLPDVLYGQTAIVNQNGQFLRMRRHTAPEQLDWKSFKNGMLVCHQAFFPKRELVELYNLKYRFSSDFDWCINILKKSKQIHYTELTLIKYLNEGLTTENQHKSLLERFSIMSKHYGLPETILRHIGFVFRHFTKK